MPTGSKKEREVLERQKKLAEVMASKRRPSESLASSKPLPPPAAPSHTDTSSSLKNPAKIVACGLTFSKKPPSQQDPARRANNRKTKENATTIGSKHVVNDLIGSKPQQNGDSSQNPSASSAEKVLGIHKSFKRPSPAAAIAKARAKVQKATTTDHGDEPASKKAKTIINDNSSNGDDGKSSAGKSSQTKSASTGGNRLKHLVQNVAPNSYDVLDIASYALNLKPEDFWKNIRNWDFVADLAKHQLEDSRDNTRKENGKSDTNRPVPNTFINTRHYIAVWAPLCLAECRSQLLSEFLTDVGQMNSRNSPFVLVNVDTTWKSGNRHDRQIHSELTELSDSCQVMLKTENHGNGSKLQFFPQDICCLVPVEKKDIVENLLRASRRSTNNPKNHKTHSSQFHHTFGFQEDDFRKVCLMGHTEVHRNSINGLILKVSKRRWAQVGQSEMYLLKIGSNVTAFREFTAICSVDQNPLSKYLLGRHLVETKHNKSESLPRQSLKEIDGSNPDQKLELLKRMGGVEALGKGFTKYVHKKFNPSQLMAISASSQGYGEGGFTLIKGPPGTGKTTTLVNILNALHIRQFNKYYDEVRRIVARESGSRSSALDLARTHKPRLLVCAPSNAAVDNIILKIMEDGFIDGSGQRYNPSMIRVGVGQSKAVKDVALETKVDQILSENLDPSELDNAIAGYKMELQRISMDIAKCQKRIHAIAKASPWPLSRDWEIRIDESTFDESGRVYFVNHKEQATTYEIPPPPEPGETQYSSRSMPEYRAFMSRTVKLVESQLNIKSNLGRATIVKGLMGTGTSNFEVRQNLEMHELNSVHMVMTTLGTSGSRALNDGVDKFEVVVVDEAAQSVEPATLSALQRGSRHCVMVGDPQQLPATIFNVSGKTTKYDRSLFQRLEEAGEEVYMLNEQYRMHPKISHFPRHIFYKGALKDGPNVRKPDYGSPVLGMISSAIPAFQPFTVLDLDSKEERGGTSLSNSTEAQLAVHLYVSLKDITNGLVGKDRVAVITPYSQQASLLKRYFGDLLGNDFAKFIEVNTVDAFQGREAKIVIFSAVRAAGSLGIGFLSDVRRMNVALTRAKYFLFVIARCDSIVVNPYWNELVEHARDINAVVKVPILGRYNGKTTFPPIHEWSLIGGSRSIQPPQSQVAVGEHANRQTFGSFVSSTYNSHPLPHPNDQTFHDHQNFQGSFPVSLAPPTQNYYQGQIRHHNGSIVNTIPPPPPPRAPPPPPPRAPPPPPPRAPPPHQQPLYQQCQSALPSRPPLPPPSTHTSKRMDPRRKR